MERRRLGGLYQVGVSSEVIAEIDVDFALRRGEDHNRRLAPGWTGLYLAQHFKPRLDRHGQVKENCERRSLAPRPELVKVRQCLPSVSPSDDLSWTYRLDCGAHLFDLGPGHRRR